MPVSYNPFAPPIFPAQQQPTNPILAGRTPSPSYNTPLSPLDEFAYRQWVQQNHVPTDPNATTPQDYDMRGFYQGLQQGNPRAQSAVDANDGRLHFNDFWKTPSHQKFSAESQFAPPTAPVWADNPYNQLLSQDGRVLSDDRTRPFLPDDKSQNYGLLGLLNFK